MFFGSKLVHVVNMWDFLLREGGRVEHPESETNHFFSGEKCRGLNFLVKMLLKFWTTHFQPNEFPNQTREFSPKLVEEKESTIEEKKIYPLNKNLNFWSNFRHKNSGAKFHCCNQNRVKHGEPRNLEVDPQSMTLRGLKLS